MNFNLTAPEGKCDDFNIAFKEPITIDENSEIQFNWAKFVRRDAVEFERDTAIIIDPIDGIPDRIPNQPAVKTLNQLTASTSNRIIIPRGTYSAYDLQEAIKRRWNLFISRQWQGFIPNNGWHTQPYLEYVRSSVNRNRDGQDIAIGMEYKYPNQKSFLDDVPNFNALIAPLPNPIHGYNNIYNLTGAFSDYQKTTAVRNDADGNPTYDNYMISSPHFFHYGEKERVDFGNGVDNKAQLYRQWEKLSCITAQSTISIGDWQDGTHGNMVMGLYSQEVAENNGISTDDTRTRGNTDNNNGNINPALFLGAGGKGTSGTPKLYVSVELGKNYGHGIQDDNNNDNLMIKVAFKGANPVAVGSQLKNFDITDTIGGMRTVFMVRLTELQDLFEEGLDYHPKICLFTYYDKSIAYDFKNQVKPVPPFDGATKAYLNEAFLHFKVGLITEAEYEGSIIPTFLEIYDSGLEPNNQFSFDRTFFNTFENLGNGQNSAQINTQIPFNLFLSAQGVNEGWEEVAMKGIPKYDFLNNGYNYNDNPLVICRGYNLRLPEIIGKMIDPTHSVGEYISRCLYLTPQLEALYDEDENYLPYELYIDDIRQRYKTKDITIYIEGLPLDNYKNTILSDTKGSRKAILATCATPFVEDNIVANLDIGFYSPMNVFLTKLKNQKVQTNNLRIQIRDAETDKPLTNLLKVSIDFTIFNKN